MEPFRSGRSPSLAILCILTVVVGGASALLGLCGPFTDVAADAFCPFVLEVFYLGVTTGTTPATYDPASPVSRLQMAAFLSRSVDAVLKRSSRRAALNRFWTTQDTSVLGLTALNAPRFLQSDGQDLWVSSSGGSVYRVRASDGKLLDTWTGATQAHGVVAAGGRVFVTGVLDPGRLYMIDPTQPAGAVTTVASNLGAFPNGIAFDGARIWTANLAVGGGVSIVTPGAVIPWTVTTVAAGFQSVMGALFDGANIWVTDSGPGTLLKLDGAGTVLQTVTAGSQPSFPVFDGTNIWVPNWDSNSVTVVRASTGAVLQTLTGNGLSSPIFAAFDGQRILVTNFLGPSVSLWEAADLSPIGSFPTGLAPRGACSDGVDFWVGLLGANRLARF